MKELRLLPASLEFAKRVRKPSLGEGAFADVLLGPSGDPATDAAAAALGLPILTVEVAERQPATRRQFEAVKGSWPVTFREDPVLEAKLAGSHLSPVTPFLPVRGSW